MAGLRVPSSWLLLRLPTGWSNTIFSHNSRNDSTAGTDTFLSSLLFQMSSDHPFQFGASLGFGFLDRVGDAQGDQLFKLIRFLELLEVQSIQQLLIWLYLHRDGGFVPLPAEGLHVISPEFDVQEV